MLTVEGLLRRGHEVRLLAGPADGPVGGIYRELEEADRLVIIPHLRRQIDPASDLLAFWEIWRYLRAHPCEVVHTHSSKAGILGRWAARLAGVPLVVHTVHGYSFHRGQPWLVNCFYRWLERAAAPATDLLLAVSRTLAEEARRWKLAPAGEVEVVYSAVNLEPFLAAGEGERARVRAELGLGPEDLVLGAVGRLVPLKGHRFLLEAVKRLGERRGRAIKAMLIGEGPCREELDCQARRLGIEGQVLFLGLRSDVPALLAAVDVFVHTSLWEGLPRVVVEALAAGRPVVAFAVDGVPEALGGGERGLLVEPEDVEGLCEAIERLAGDVDLRTRLSEAGRRWVVQHYRPEVMVERIEGLYREHLARRPGRFYGSTHLVPNCSKSLSKE